MAFRFSLATLLRLRVSQEHQQELLLHSANQQLQRIAQDLASLQSLESDLSATAKSLLAGGMAAVELHFVDQCLNQLERQKNLARKKIAEARRELTVRLAAFEEARRQRRMIEEIRDRQKNSYHQTEARREQRILDDLYLVLRNRGRTG